MVHAIRNTKWMYETYNLIIYYGHSHDMILRHLLVNLITYIDSLRDVSHYHIGSGSQWRSISPGLHNHNSPIRPWSKAVTLPPPPLENDFTLNDNSSQRQTNVYAMSESLC